MSALLTTVFLALQNRAIASSALVGFLLMELDYVIGTQGVERADAWVKSKLSALEKRHLTSGWDKLLNDETGSRIVEGLISLVVGIGALHGVTPEDDNALIAIGQLSLGPVIQVSGVILLIFAFMRLSVAIPVLLGLCFMGVLNVGIGVLVPVIWMLNRAPKGAIGSLGWLFVLIPLLVDVIRKGT